MRENGGAAGEEDPREILLVVEGNEDMNSFIVQSLSRDYQVIPAFNGHEGLQKALDFHPSLIACDITAPRTGGVEMITELRRRPEMLDTPILLLTAETDDELKHQLLEDGAQDFITRPFSELDLRIRIRNLISIKKSQQALRDKEITKREAKRLLDNEQVLKEQSNWLEQQVEQRTKALIELNQSLKLSNEDLQQFAHVASHDLKEPIRKIKTYSSRLQDDYKHLLPEKANEFLHKILSATNRIYSMIDGVLSYSTIASMDEPAEIVDLNEVLKNIQTDLELPIQEKKVVFNIDPLPQLEGFPVLLYQLFYNLINNSIKFSKQTERPVITVKYSTVDFEGNIFAKIVIGDNGIGFDQTYAEKIFTTFIRLNSKEKYEGTGLGLALCKKIAHRHDGFISAKGEKNKGAEFTVLLPATSSFR